MNKLLRIVAGITVIAACWIISAQIGAYLFAGGGAIIVAVVGLYLGIRLGFKIIFGK